MNDRLASERAVYSAFNAVLSELFIGKGRLSDKQLRWVFREGYLYSLNLVVTDNSRGWA